MLLAEWIMVIFGDYLRSRLKRYNRYSARGAPLDRLFQSIIRRGTNIIGNALMQGFFNGHANARSCQIDNGCSIITL